MDGKASVVTEKPISRTSTEKKSRIKVPKKIHKSEREKQKRDHLNELFFELGRALEPERQNNGKACLLSDATRILRNLISQVESLRKENAGLHTETQYVTAERNELKDETATLGSKVDNLKSELRAREHTNHPSLINDASNAMPSTLQPPASVLPLHQATMPSTLQPPASVLPLHQATMPPIVGPLYVIPLGQDPNSHPRLENEAAASRQHPPVSRPHPRYPNSDSWPEHLLLQQTTVTIGREGFNSGCSTTTNCREVEDLSPSTELRLS